MSVASAVLTLLSRFTSPFFQVDPGIGVGVEAGVEPDAELDIELEVELEDELDVELELDPELEDGSIGSVGFSIEPGSGSGVELDDELGRQYVNVLDFELDDELEDELLDDELDVEIGTKCTLTTILPLPCGGVDGTVYRIVCVVVEPPP